MSKAWKILCDAGLPEGAPRSATAPPIDVERVAVAASTVLSDADGLTEREAELVLAWATALRDHWPTAAATIIAGPAVAALDRLSRRVTDEGRTAKLRRLAIGYVAGRL